MAITSSSYVSVNGFRERQTPLIRELRRIIENKDRQIDILKLRVAVLEKELDVQNEDIDLTDFLKDIKG